MTSKDDPFGPAGKTVIRSKPRRERTIRPLAKDPVTGVQPSPIKESTVFDPGVGRRTPPGWASGTVIYQGAPVAAAGGASGAAQNPAPARGTLLRATGNIHYSAANPILAAAAPLLLLLGQLRLVPVEKQAGALAEHVAGAIEKFDRAVEKAGVPEEDGRIARFVLCETVDDLIGNLPWPDTDAWAPHGMLSRFFHMEPAGTGFFEALNKLLARPEAHYELLELMHGCLSLGFEGQYRGKSRDDGSLERVRRDVYETLRYFKARADDDISPRWQTPAAGMTQSRTRLPWWIFAATASALLTAIFFALRVVITSEGDAAAGELLALEPSTPISIERASVVPLAEPEKAPRPAVATTTQIDRIRSALAGDVAAGSLKVGTKGNFIVVEINNLLLFEPGKAEAKPEFQPIAADLAAALDHEPGPIRIIGHTDNVKPRKTSPFKSNFDLSVARAKAVEAMMAARLSDPSRLTAGGKGEDEPIADNATPEGRASNRRVDVMIAREETL